MTVTRWISGLSLALVGLLAGDGSSSAAADLEPTSLSSAAAAILRQHCFACHGRDPAKVRGDGLKILNHAQLIAADRKIVMPRQPDRSELIKRIEESDEDNRMPPEPHPALTPEDRKTLRDWVLAGAEPFPQDLPAANAEHEPPDLAAQAKELFRAHCFECHGGVKTNAGLSILDARVLIDKKKVVPGKPDESQLVQLIAAVDDSVMPPSGQPRLSAENVQTIRRWIGAGAKAFPPDIAMPTDAAQNAALAGARGRDYVLNKILAHVRMLPAPDRPFVRYFSINHLLAGGATREELDLQADALAKAVNHLSLEPKIARPEPIDEPRTIFALDIRKVGWHKQPFERRAGDKAVGPSALNLFDLALLEYPYGIVYEDSAAFDGLVEDFIAPAGLVRPIPYVRADWFASTATQPPLYEDFLQLPVDIATLEQRLGVDSAENLRGAIARRAGMVVSGVSRNNRVVERHPTSVGAYWKSFDFSSNKGTQSIFYDPLDLSPAGGEMIFTLPNGLQGYYIATGSGRRLELAPTDIVTDKFAENKTVVNGLSCIRCHDRGIKSVADDVRKAIEKLPGSPGFDKRRALAIYATAEEMETLVQKDGERFVRALDQTIGRSQQREPLAPVSSRFLDAPLQMSAASAELGLNGPLGLEQVFRSPTFVGLGLAPLASGGAIRRDTFEDYYDQIVRDLGLGIPLVPFDGLTRDDYPPVAPAIAVELSTNRKNNVFAPGDELVLFVNNRGAKEVHFELIGCGADGEKLILAPATSIVQPGGQFRFPAVGGIRIQGGIGKERIMLIAGEQQFPAGEVLRAAGIADRVVHPFYQLTEGNPRIKFDPRRLIKKTITIETR